MMNKCWFLKHRGDRQTKAHVVSWFYCNRSGCSSSRGKGKRNLKTQGTSKINGSCSAFVTTRTDLVTGEVEAEYCLRHRGHRRELCHNRISSELRAEVAGKLAQGVSMTAILDSIRDSCVGPVRRDHLTSRKDLHNIKLQYNLNLIQKDSDDAKSVLLWVSEMQAADFNPVLCFKSQGDPSTYTGVEDNDFLLGIQTEFHKEMFENHAMKLICVDATHGTNSYDFQLITVMVVDDFDQGVPVAWLISNRENEATLSVFFSAIRSRCRDVKTDVFMSDDAEQYYNAWARSFERPSKKLLCSWHVDRSWRRKLNECVKDKEVNEF